MHHRLLPSLTVATVLLSVPVTQAQETVYGSDAYQFTATTIVEGLEIPWSMTWLPNGDMLVTEWRPRRTPGPGSVQLRRRHRPTQ